MTLFILSLQLGRAAARSGSEAGRRRGAPPPRPCAPRPDRSLPSRFRAHPLTRCAAVVVAHEPGDAASLSMCSFTVSLISCWAVDEMHDGGLGLDDLGHLWPFEQAEVPFLPAFLRRQKVVWSKARFPVIAHIFIHLGLDSVIGVLVVAASGCSDMLSGKSSSRPVSASGLSCFFADLHVEVVRYVRSGRPRTPWRISRSSSPCDSEVDEPSMAKFLPGPGPWSCGRPAASCVPGSLVAALLHLHDVHDVLWFVYSSGILGRSNLSAC